MSRGQIVTANDLRLGDVVYLTAAGTWSRAHHDALLLNDPDQAAAHLARASLAQVVGPYLADARPGPNGPEPIHFREVFRTRGPSNYPHGKQQA